MSRMIGTGVDQERWRKLKQENEAERQAQQQARLDAQGGPMERVNETHSAMGGAGSYETVGRRPRGSTPMDFIGQQAPQQPFGPMQFLQSKQAAIGRMQEGMQGKVRPKTFEEEMAESRMAEDTRQFDEGMGLKREALGAETDYNKGRLGLGERELQAQGQTAQQKAEMTRQQFEADQRMKQQELASKPELLKQRGQQVMDVEKFKQGQIGERQAAEKQETEREALGGEIEDVVKDIQNAVELGYPDDVVQQLKSRHMDLMKKYYGFNQPTE